MFIPNYEHITPYIKNITKRVKRFTEVIIKIKT